MVGSRNWLICSRLLMLGWRGGLLAAVIDWPRVVDLVFAIAFTGSRFRRQFARNADHIAIVVLGKFRLINDELPAMFIVNRRVAVANPVVPAVVLFDHALQPVVTGVVSKAAGNLAFFRRRRGCGK